MMLTCHSYDVPLEAVDPATGEETLCGAVRYLAPRVRAFYLNLDQEIGRRHSIEGQLAAAGMHAERVQAVDGSKLLPAELWAYFQAQHLMAAGALGCYASHIKAWEKILRKDLPYALVLEDDAILAPGLSRLLSDVVTALPKAWDMVHLGTEPDRAVCEVARVGS